MPNRVKQSGRGAAWRLRQFDRATGTKSVNKHLIEQRQHLLALFEQPLDRVHACLPFIEPGRLRCRAAKGRKPPLHPSREGCRLQSTAAPKQGVYRPAPARLAVAKTLAFLRMLAAGAPGQLAGRTREGSGFMPGGSSERGGPAAPARAGEESVSLSFRLSAPVISGFPISATRSHSGRCGFRQTRFPLGTLPRGRHPPKKHSGILRRRVRAETVGFAGRHRLVMPTAPALARLKKRGGFRRHTRGLPPTRFRSDPAKFRSRATDPPPYAKPAATAADEADGSSTDSGLLRPCPPSPAPSPPSETLHRVCRGGDRGLSCGMVG
jgi:hypothetical protein